MLKRPSVLSAAAACGLGIVLLGAACPRRAEPGTPDAPRAESPTAPEAQMVGAQARGSGDSVGPRFSPKPAGARLAVLYTASVQGYVTPCGCTADPLGGVARLAAAVDEARAAYGERVVFIDAGDLLFEKPDDDRAADRCQAEARVDLLLSTYARKGLVATITGPLDDVRGATFRDERLARLGVASVGVNGRSLQAGAKRARGLLHDAGGVKVGITGFRVDEVGGAKAAREAVTAEVERLRAAGATFVLALAQAPRPLTKEVTEGLAGLDVVVQGRDPGEAPSAPERLGATGPVLVAAGMQAQHLGVLEVVLEQRAGTSPLLLDDREAAAARRARLLDARVAQYEQQVSEEPDPSRKAFLQKRVEKAKAERAEVFEAARRAPPPEGPHLIARALALPRGAPEEEAAKAALAAYESQIPVLVAACEAGITCEEPKPGAATYVGVATCQACHAAAAAFWRAQAVTTEGKDAAGNPVERTLSHARAWETLEHNGKDKDRSCVGCHSVGFNEPGGYCRTSDVGELKGVQCESCHGPGSLHVDNGGDKRHIREETPESTCRGCHHVPHIPSTESFVYSDKLKLILGEGHGAAKLAEILSGR